MDRNHSGELPIRSKLEMIKDMIQIIHCLHHGRRSAAEPLIDDLKIRSIFMDEQIQQDVLMFSEQIHFQYDYDPWHRVTAEVQRAADKLIEDLGFCPPR
jgi:hypothetical protein